MEGNTPQTAETVEPTPASDAEVSVTQPVATEPKQAENPNPAPTKPIVTDHIVKGILIWFLPIIGGLMYVGDDDKMIVTHARQSIAFSIITVLFVGVVNLIPFIGAIVSFLVPIVYIVVAVLMVMKFNKNQTERLPFVDEVVKMIWNK